jgi:hypothetical protein
VGLFVKGASFDVGKNAIDINGGGVAITTYPGENDPKLEGDDDVPDLAIPFFVKIKMKNGSWCIHRSIYSSTKVDGCKVMADNEVVLLRDKHGLVIGVVAKAQASLLVKQVQKPYQKNGYTLDATKPAIEIKTENGDTVAALANYDDIEPRVTVKGDSERINVSNLDFKKLDLTSGKKWLVDCAGPKVQSTVPAEPVQTTHFFH